VVAVLIFVATRSVADLSERLRMRASVSKIKNGIDY
jgi:guanylate kinase